MANHEKQNLYEECIPTKHDSNRSYCWLAKRILFWVVLLTLVGLSCAVVNEILVRNHLLNELNEVEENLLTFSTDFITKFNHLNNTAEEKERCLNRINDDREKSSHKMKRLLGEKPKLDLSLTQVNKKTLKKGSLTLNWELSENKPSVCKYENFQVNDDGTVMVKHPGRYYIHSQIPFICTGKSASKNLINEHIISYYGDDIGQTLPLSISNFKPCDADEHVHVSTQGGVYQLEQESLLSVQVMHDNGMEFFANDTMKARFSITYVSYDRYI